MKEHILRNEEKVTQLQSSVTSSLASLTEDVVSLNSSDKQQGALIEGNIQRLETLSTILCGYQDEWAAENSVISYDSVSFAGSNMNVS